MKRSRFSEEQIIEILKEHDGVSVVDLCRKHGVSDTSIYKWKAKFGGMEVSVSGRCESHLADYQVPRKTTKAPRARYLIDCRRTNARQRQMENRELA
ncbi:transposase-like protein [Bradyrhizobium sp. cir1]|nr:transposase-like protein [Bradyrhizobium sp. cir1]